MLGFKIIGLVFVPDKTGKFGNRGLRGKPVDIADFGDDTGRIDLANAGDGGQRIPLNRFGKRSESADSVELVVNRLCDTICSLSNNLISSITGRDWIIKAFN